MEGRATMNIYDKIRLMRDKSGITVNDLANTLNYSTGLISLIEQGKRSVKPEMLILIRKSMKYEEVPLTEEEVINFRLMLYDFYESIKNLHLGEAREKSDAIRPLVEKCFEEEFKVLYYLFDSYLLIREQKHEKAKNQLETLTDKIETFTDEQKYFYFYFYAGSIYKDYAQTIQYLLKAKDIAQKINKQEASLYYSLSNIYSRIDYSPKAIIYGEIALKLAQNSVDKAYLLNIEATLAFEYSKVGFPNLALERLYGCLAREKTLGNPRRLGNIHHNLGCIFLRMKDYANAEAYFNKSLKYCEIGDWAYLNNKLYIAYMLIDKGERNNALAFIEELLPLAQNTSDILLFLESAKHSLDLKNVESLDYLENTSIPQLLKMGQHLKAIKYMSILSVFHEKRSRTKQAIKKSHEYLKLIALYRNKILKGEID